MNLPGFLLIALLPWPALAQAIGPTPQMNALQQQLDRQQLQLQSPPPPGPGLQSLQTNILEQRQEILRLQRQPQTPLQQQQLHLLEQQLDRQQLQLHELKSK